MQRVSLYPGSKRRVWHTRGVSPPYASSQIILTILKFFFFFFSYLFDRTSTTCVASCSPSSVRLQRRVWETLIAWGELSLRMHLSNKLSPLLPFFFLFPLIFWSENKLPPPVYWLPAFCFVGMSLNEKPNLVRSWVASCPSIICSYTTSGLWTFWLLRRFTELSSLVCISQIIIPKLYFSYISFDRNKNITIYWLPALPVGMCMNEKPNVRLCCFMHDRLSTTSAA